MHSPKADKHNQRPLFTILSILTLILTTSQVVITLSRGLNLTHVSVFTRSLSLFTKHAILIFFSFITLHSLFPKLTTSPKKTKLKPWRPFILFLTSIILFSFLVNSRGRINISFIPALNNTSRLDKFGYYAILPKPPNMVIFGSSRTFTISPSYIYESLGYNAFNFSIDDASMVEPLIQMRFIDNKSSSFPEILLLETPPSLPSDKQSAAKRAVFAMLPYMDPETAGYFILSEASSLISIHTLTESIYTLQFFVQNPSIIPKWTFQPDGLGVINSPPPTPEEFMREIQAKKELPTCTKHSPESIALLTEIVQFAYDRKSAIIIYNGPLQPDFYETFIQPDQTYLRCGQLLLDLITSLQKSYPNLFFLDFTHIESFNGLPGQDGFYDTHHLTYQNSNLLIDAAAPTIHQAYQYALNEREKTP